LIYRNNTINPEKILFQILDELRITDNKIKLNTSLLVGNLKVSNNDEFWINIMKAIVVVCDENKYAFQKLNFVIF
jgi:hypothetical protein